MGKKYWFFGLLVCAFFYEPIALQGAGLFLKLLARFQYHCSLSFDSIAWREGKLHLTEVFCRDPTFSLQTPEVTYSLAERHLQVKQPVLSLFKPSDQLISFDGTLTVEAGVIQCKSVEPIQFSFEWQGHSGVLNLQCLKGLATIEIDPESTQVTLHEWPAAVLSKACLFYSLPIPEITAGCLTGTVEVSEEIHGQLTVKNLCHDRIKGLGGSMSYHSDLGAKWDLKGEAVDLFPVTCCGRSYLKSELSNWTDVEVTLGPDTQILIQGHEEGEGEIWTARYETLGVVQASLELKGLWERWQGQAKALGIVFDLNGGFQNGELLVEGEGQLFEGLFFKCPLLSWQGGQIEFDLRLENPTLDLARCKGAYVGSHIQLDPKSHILGSPLKFDGSKLEGEMDWQALSLLVPSLRELPLQGLGLIQLNNEQLIFSNKNLVWDGRPLPSVSASCSSSGKLQLAGAVSGEGHVSWGDRLEVDLDLAPIQIEELQTQGLTHLFYTPDEGVFVKGIDLLSPMRCKADVLRLDPLNGFWNLTNARLHVPEIFDGTADLQWNGHHFAAYIQDGLVSIQKAVVHVQDGQVEWDGKVGSGFVHALHQGERFKVLFEAALHSGFCSIEGLRLDWDYDEPHGLTFRSIEGDLKGSHFSFRAEEPYGALIGTAHVDFTTLSVIIPPVVSQVFTSLEMGKGYELKGRLTNRAEFKGVLIGKAVELFGFEFQTAFANLDLSLTKVLITDLKVSDKAGTLMVDQILVEEPTPEDLWILDIPHITISEMRPCFLKTLPDKKEDPINPLVVRELHLDGLKGFAKDIKTYTAQGELVFINSFRREFSVLDLPADLLSRIVGLDLELLIPVKGTLTYHLKDGLFRLDALLGSFSEGHRSEFFLVDEANPCMDFDGNLNIVIKMKQYVLFKLTESFLISIDGNLSDPKYHLQKRRRFLGL